MFHVVAQSLHELNNDINVGMMPKSEYHMHVQKESEEN